MESFRLIEHTADIGIEVSADSRAGLFIAAARALRRILSETDDASVELEESVEIDGGDDGELLINWLNEIVFLLETRNLFPNRFAIDTLSGGRLRGRIGGIPLGAGRQSIDREVKAATYHQLRVERRDDTWFARVYLDL